MTLAIGRFHGPIGISPHSCLRDSCGAPKFTQSNMQDDYEVNPSPHPEDYLLGTGSVTRLSDFLMLMSTNFL